MDESFVFCIADNLLGKISSIAAEETFTRSSLAMELERLKDTLTSIRAIVLDAEYKKAQNRHLSDWLFKLKDALYDADDVADEIKTLWRQSKVNTFLCFPISLPCPMKIRNKIEEVRVKLDELLDAKSKFHLVERVQDDFVMNMTDVSNSIVRPSNIIGRDKDKENIIQRLMHNGDGDENISAVPIVGLGGLGKTTLAQLVYNDERVKEHFQIKTWVCVSQEFDMKRLMIDIIKSASDENLGDCTISELTFRLRDTLYGKRFLLVLDDVWNDNREKWDELKEFLYYGSSGSKIVLTTRSMLVASIIGSNTPPYVLQGLTKEESRSVFAKVVFEEGQEKKHPNLMLIGDEMITKCRGIPLALKSLGGLLRLNTDERFWASVRDNEEWLRDSSLLVILKMSFELMPSHLKLCFSCLSLFPKNYEFNSTDLIQFWMAQGLITSTDKAKELEEIGEQYIRELLSISFIHDGQVHDLYTGFQMHDLIHDLTLFLAQHECWSVNFPARNIPRIVRHVSFCDSDLSQEEVLKTLLNLNSSLRTVMFPIKGVGPSSNSFVETCVRKFNCLRVLDLSDSSFERLPSFIGKLKHLRLLSLADNHHIKKLPKSICKLHNLQTLRLFGCLELEELPKDIGNLTRLRFLYITTKQMSLKIGSLISLRFLSISYCRNLESLDENVMESLTSLRTLWIVRCESLKCLPSTLENLTMLKINGCPELARRCQPEIGEDWHKIAHIPVITTDSQKIELLGN